MAMGEAGSPERRLMQQAVRQSMRDGAFGVASALVYPPGNFASTEELISVNAAAAPFGGVYITHMRSEADNFLEAIDEAIEIGTQAGVPIEIYHLKAAGQRNWHKAALAVAKIDSARAAGVDIQANMYPYTAGGTGLDACFPPWASADGLLFDNLQNPEMRGRIRAEMEMQTEPWEAFCSLATPGGTMPLGLNLPEHQQYRGWWLEDIAEDMGKDWIDTAMDLVLNERQRVSTMYFLMSEDNVAMQIAQPWIKFGTDAGGMDPTTATGLAHPRAYGTFTRVLGKYVREEGATTLEEAVRKMSSAVSTRLNIRDRGFLREGYFADVIVFDPETVGDHATYDEPHQLSTGIDHVFVNGVPVVRDGEHTDAMPGRAVRGPGWTGWENQR
jgi:dihydroorotase/N-acyl-D-amino-acid deacylase